MDIKNDIAIKHAQRQLRHLTMEQLWLTVDSFWGKTRSPDDDILVQACNAEIGRRRPDIKAMFEAVERGEDCEVPPCIFEEDVPPPGTPSRRSVRFVDLSSA